jgi:hypothetical protein
VHLHADSTASPLSDPTCDLSVSLLDGMKSSWLAVFLWHHRQTGVFCNNRTQYSTQTSHEFYQLIFLLRKSEILIPKGVLQALNNNSYIHHSPSSLSYNTSIAFPKRILHRQRSGAVHCVHPATVSRVTCYHPQCHCVHPATVSRVTCYHPQCHCVHLANIFSVVAANTLLQRWKTDDNRLASTCPFIVSLGIAAL